MVQLTATALYSKPVFLAMASFLRSAGKLAASTISSL
jgi:hypothetical protein